MIGLCNQQPMQQTLKSTAKETWLKKLTTGETYFGHQKAFSDSHVYDQQSQEYLLHHSGISQRSSAID